MLTRIWGQNITWQFEISHLWVFPSKRAKDNISKNRNVFQEFFYESRPSIKLLPEKQDLNVLTE